MRTIFRVLAAALLLTLGLTGDSRAAHFLWLETETFHDIGGWTNDAQFIDQMGSPYLLAIGLDGPVKDAVTTAEVPAAGKYRLWARARDWTPEFSPGRFQVALAGKTVEHVFGQTKKKGWVWEDGGTVQLAAGKLDVGLHDLTGYYGRCDVIVLTDDLDFTPPDDLAAIAKLREQHGGVTREAKRLPAYDTVVVGGGLAGTIAAVASARGGARTALVQNRPVLGGNGSSEVLVNPEGDTTREPLDPGEGGIIEEFRGPVQGYSERMLKVVQRQANLDLYLNMHATGVEMKDKGQISAIETLETTTGKRFIIPGRVFIDCTGDADIGVWAGAEYRHGREPRAMYNETRAPETADTHTMGNTLRYATQKMLTPQPFSAPDWARKFRQPSDFGPGRTPQLNFGGWQWVIEYGGMLNTYRDAEDIRDELLRIIWGMWDYAKNYSPTLKHDAENYKLTWVSYVAGKRESRRLIGDYIMTEHDIDPTRLFPDRVSYGGWGVDLHPPGGFYDKGPPAEFSHKYKFSVPFRSLYSKNVDNLMMAGRCISVSHAALGATRVMITCGLQGQAVGTAAGICKQRDALPRKVGQDYIVELQQQLLKDGCYLIDLPDQDPRDLARNAVASATSQAAASALKASVGDSHALDNDRAVMFRVVKEPIDRVSLHLISANDAATPITMKLYAAEKLGEFATTKEVTAATTAVPPNSKGWVEFKLDAKVEPGLYFVMLPKTKGLRWTLFANQPPNTSRAYRGGKGWTTMSGCYAFQYQPGGEEALKLKLAPEPQGEPFAAASVVNGFARAIRGWPNAWRPDPEKPLPQSVELDLGRPVAFNTVYVVFQSRLMRATAFRLEGHVGGQWKTLSDIADNDDRRRVVSFDRVTADKLRLVLLKTMADAGVCEIRVYDEP